MSLISVVIPVYNAELYLDDCIRSVTKQNFDDIEIILVDDGSTDNSLTILRDWERKDLRIKVVHQQNSGVTLARKKGVELSQSEWISFVDADDILPCNALEILAENINESDLVLGQVDYVGPGKWKFVTRNELLTPVQYIKKMYQDIIHSVPFARLIKKSILLDPFIFNIPKGISHGEDTIMNYRIATRCKKIRTVPNIVYTYIIREGSASHQNKFASLSYCHLYEKIEWMSFPETIKKELFFLRWQTILQRRKRFLKTKVKEFLKKV